MSTVKVVTPNFKHITVKISPNMTLLQILEEASRRSELDPNMHDLKHNRTVLDLTQMFRFSGLPSNCELILIPAKSARKDDNDIPIVLQTETRGRMEGTFKPANTLLEIIMQMCPEEADLATNPVIIFMRSDVHGENLATTTLKSLGLTSGRGMLRLIHKNPEELKTQANVSGNLPIKATKPLSDDVPRRGNSSCLKDLLKEAQPKENESETKEIEAVAGSSKDTFVPEEPNTSALMERVDPEPIPKRNLEFTKEDLERLEKETHRLDDFNTVIYSLDSVVASSLDNETPDSFFDLTVRDIRVLMSHLKHSSKSVDNAPLMTSKLRELEDSKRTLNQLRYKETLIRVQLPGRMVLQTVFKPIDTVLAVKQFLKRFLKEDVGDFHLFTTPPKFLLEEDLRLVELHCVPQALIHFGSSNQTSEVIKEEFLKLSTAAAADFLAAKIRGRIEMIEPVCESDTPDDAMDIEASPSPLQGDFPESKKRIAGGTFKVSSTVAPNNSLPKWFKPSK